MLLLLPIDITFAPFGNQDQRRYMKPLHAIRESSELCLNPDASPATFSVPPANPPTPMDNGIPRPRRRRSLRPRPRFILIRAQRPRVRPAPTPKDQLATLATPEAEAAWCAAWDGLGKRLEEIFKGSDLPQTAEERLEKILEECAIPSRNDFKLISKRRGNRGCESSGDL
ncbi:hypothetical protein R3P38DRAFT_3221859 [Favolaschia claudopus]|uniref:Uncharacterized protein n=1 Tax=Favolaschia claudopus TaxID=2862362 RepID=A0AAW0A0A5_9AGAR